MKELKQILTELTDGLEAVATNLGAMEAALTEQGTISADDIDSHKGILSPAHTSAKHELLNIRYLISRLPE